MQRGEAYVYYSLSLNFFWAVLSLENLELLELFQLELQNHLVQISITSFLDNPNC